MNASRRQKWSFARALRQRHSRFPLLSDNGHSHTAEGVTEWTGNKVEFYAFLITDISSIKVSVPMTGHLRRVYHIQHPYKIIFSCLFSIRVPPLVRLPFSTDWIKTKLFRKIGSKLYSKTIIKNPSRRFVSENYQRKIHFWYIGVMLLEMAEPISTAYMDRPQSPFTLSVFHPLYEMHAQGHSGTQQQR